MFLLYIWRHHLNLSPVNHFIRRHFHVLFWPTLIGAFLLGFIQQHHQVYLCNDTAPKGIIDLETGRSRTLDSNIIASWKKDTLDINSFDECRDSAIAINRLKIARNDVRYADTAFILFYTLLNIIIIMTLQGRQSKQRPRFTLALIILAILAGVCDLIENQGMLRFIEEGLYTGNTHPRDNIAVLTRIMALTKFGILALLAGVYLPLTLIFRDNALRILSDYLRAKALQLFRYRVIIASMLIFTIPIWMMDQGQDLLVNSNASDTGVFLFITVILIAAAINWWLSKLFFEREYRSPLYPLNEPVIHDPTLLTAEKKVSRFLGVASILIPATAILNALQVLRIHFPLDIFPPILWLIALLACFYALIKHDIAGQCYIKLETRFGRPTAPRLVYGILLTLAFILPALIRFCIVSDMRQAPSSLSWLFIQLLLLAIAGWIFFSTRNNIFNKEGWLGKKIGWPITIAGTILIGGFVFFNIRPLSILSLDCNYLSLPLLLAGIVCYIVVFTFLIRISLRTKINFLFFIIAAALFISATATTDYHDVKIIAPQQPASKKTPAPDLDRYFRNWVLSRAAEIDSAKDSYPVFLVNTYGGGIKAAAFTNMVLTSLDEYMIANSKTHRNFGHYIFSISGASGGTIGAAVQCAFWSRHPATDTAAYHTAAFSSFYQHDFLSPILTAMLGRDVLASITPIGGWNDRSAIQEDTWTGFGKKHLDIDLGQNFDNIWNTNARTAYEIPLLFSNTLNVDDGLKGIMAPVRLREKDFPGTIFVRDRIDALHAQGLSLATGAFLSARFPFISPSGKMGAGYHFMDGGGKDNSGASTSEAIFLTLARTACGSGKTGDSTFARYAKKLKFYFVSITNNPFYDPDTRKLVSNRFEPISPIVGIINSGIYGNAQTADETLRDRYAADTLQYQGIHPSYTTIWITGSCISDGNNGFFKPVLPLGWQISEPSLNRLNQSFSPEKLRSYNQMGIPNIRNIMKDL